MMGLMDKDQFMVKYEKGGSNILTGLNFEGRVNFLDLLKKIYGTDATAS
jgi:hypothetical protein